MSNRKQVSTADRQMTVSIDPDQTESSIVKLLDVCFHDARAAGFEGDRGQWGPTEEDLDFVVDELGYKPTRDQWEAAGVFRVRSTHASREL